MISGKVQFIDPNKFGYSPSIKVNGVKYGGDSKGQFPEINPGDEVTFEAFESQSNGKSYPKYKLQTLRKVANGSNDQASNNGFKPPAGNSFAKANGSPQATSGRDSYWSDKAKTDEAKDPRIAYFASSERAIQFVDLAIRNGAFKALEKAKDTSKLEILEAFVNEQTIRIMAASYAAVVPSAVQTKEAPADVKDTTSGDPDESWS